MSNRKIALVTGGSRGLGKDMAIELAKQGIDVVITYHTNSAMADDVVSKIKSLGSNSAALQLDVSDTNSYDAFIEQFSTLLQNDFQSSTFDFLINNAGTGVYKPFANTTLEEAQQMLNIHYMAAFFLTQKALNHMNDGGSIVNITTGLTRFSFPGYVAYAAAKGAVETLTSYQARELGERRIRVNAVAPGAIETDFGGGVVRDNEDLNNMIAGMTALGRVGLADDIGSVVAFLCTDAAKWITGQRIEVSGGMNL